MRIRSQHIAYETLALQTSASECSKYKFIRPNHCYDAYAAFGEEQSSSEEFSEPMGSAVPPSYCYLRPIPVQPVIQAFQDRIENVSIEDWFRDRLPDCLTKTNNLGSDTADALTKKNNELTFPQHKNYLFRIVESMEEDVIALRKQASGSLPKLLEHRLSAPSASCVSTVKPPASQLAPRSMIIPRSKFKFENINDKSIKQLENDDWERKSALKEYSDRLLRNLHAFQNLEYHKSNDDDRTGGYAFDSWLKKRKHRWRLERICRKSMAIVEKSRVLSRRGGDGEFWSTCVLNDSNLFILIDPKLPKQEDVDNVERSGEGCFMRTHNQFFHASKLSSVQGAMSAHLEISKSRSSGIDAVSVWQNYLCGMGKYSSMNDFLQSNNVVLGGCDVKGGDHSDSSQDYSGVSFGQESKSVNNSHAKIEIDLPLAPIPSDPPLPGHENSSLQPDIPKHYSRKLPFFDLNESGSKGCMFSKRRHEKRALECQEMKKTEIYLPSTNGVHLSSVSSVVRPYQVKEGIFLPHVRRYSVSPWNCKRQEASIVALVAGSKPSFRSNRRPNEDCLIDATQSIHDMNTWMQNIRGMNTVLSDSLFNALEIQYQNSTQPGFFDLFPVYENVLAKSIEVEGEFIHLAKKSKGFGPSVALGSCALDSLSMDLRKINTPTKQETSTIETLRDKNATPAEPFMKDEVGVGKGEPTNHRKRRKRSEAKKLKKEHKRQKKEKKRERKAKRKQRKRERDREDEQSNQLALPGSETISSVQVALAPMVMTRKVRTITEEVSVAARQISTLERNNQGEFSVHQEAPAEQDLGRFYQNIKDTKREIQRQNGFLVSAKDCANLKQHEFLPHAHATSKENPIIHRIDQKIQLESNVDDRYSLTTDYIPNSTVQETQNHNHDSKECTGENTVELVVQDSNKVRRASFDDFQRNIESELQLRTTGLNYSENLGLTEACDKNQITKEFMGLQDTELSSAVDKSIQPEELNFSEKKSPLDYHNNNPDIPQAVNDQECLNQGIAEYLPTEKVQMCHNSSQDVLVQSPANSTSLKFPLLCSERFLEQFSQAAAELSSGQWIRTTLSNEYETDPNQPLIHGHFVLTDCSLVDSCDIDIEFPNRTAIKVVRLAQLSNTGAFGCKDFTKQIVRLASCGRYETIHLLIAMDMDVIDASCSLDAFLLLQNALVKQRGCICDQLSFQYLTTPALSCAIAQIAFSFQKSPVDVDLSLGSHLMEKAVFILGLAPTLTVYECFSLLEKQQNMTFGNFLLKISTHSQMAEESREMVPRKVILLQLNNCLSAATRRYRVR